MKIAGFLCIALAGITTVVDHVTAKKAGYIDAPLKACPRFREINHDDIRPFHQPPAKTIFEKAAVKFKPRLTISPHLCHAYPAVSQEGYVSGGLNPIGPSDGHCKGNRYGSQEQLPKKGDPFSNDRNDLYHRYGWQTCILWLNNPANKDPKILGVSLSFSKTFENHRDPERFKVDGTAVKVRYVGHLSNDRYSGEYGLEFIDEVGGFQDLILWHQLTEEARCALNLMDWAYPF
ncbi:unnamed protein product [Peronospora farinosa]|uniref:Uncharacterized protein n=1 Tax=Peronospora farinosa TaxID=134698 RepID=A0AAV0UMX4_9STRA|nr:unnamed protein product [Peronospora farinosa]